ncbi:MAG: ACP phosphodiesterase [Cytophagaceae bacterium]|nr:ACP phosphodiesterase [Cytophagaceae bacterium]
MNFLAHIYLSGDDDLIKLGNFMADGIKGNRYLDFSPGIRRGIILHREIDTYTDAHPIVRQSTRRLHENYSHYSGVIVDIYYDHFLAKNWSHYYQQPLEAYVEDFYKLLYANFDRLTPKIKNMVPHMVRENWLLSYAGLDGIATVLYNMNRRTKNRSGMDKAINDLQEHYTAFEEEFTMFFEELMRHCATKLEEIKLDIP